MWVRRIHLPIAGPDRNLVAVADIDKNGEQRRVPHLEFLSQCRYYSGNQFAATAGAARSPGFSCISASDGTCALSKCTRVFRHSRLFRITQKYRSVYRRCVFVPSVHSRYVVYLISFYRSKCVGLRKVHCMEWNRLQPFPNANFICSLRWCVDRNSGLDGYCMKGKTEERTI